MRFHLKFLSALGAVLFAASFGYAQDPAPGPSSGPTEMMQPDSPDDSPALAGDPDGWNARGFYAGRRMEFARRMAARRHPGLMLAHLVNNPDLCERVGITDEQAAKIRQQLTDYRKAQIRNGADLRIKRIELRSLMAAEKPDRAAIDRKLQEVGAAQLAREKSAVDFHLTMRDALTPEQRQKLRQLHQEMRRNAPGREGRGPLGMHPHGAPDATLPPNPD